MKKQCTVPECDREAHGQGYCTLHYQRLQKTGDPLVVKRPYAGPGTPRKRCTIPDCGREAWSANWCRLHHNRFKATGDPLKTKINSRWEDRNLICRIEGCNLPVHSREMCSLHYQRWHSNGDPEVTVKAPKGEGLYYRDGKALYTLHDSRLPLDATGRVKAGWTKRKHVCFCPHCPHCLEVQSANSFDSSQPQ